MKYLFSSLLILSLFVACKKEEVQTQSGIITADSSGTMGQLTVDVYYLDSVANVEKEATNADVYLYASYDDVTTDKQNNAHDLSLYHLTTSSSSNEAYFGYINNGNYYVWASATIHRLEYEQVSIVQVRPQQDEYLDVIMVVK